MKVLVLSHGFQPEYEAGFCNGLAAQGHAVTLLASDGTLFERLDPRIDAPNLRGSQDPARPRAAKALNLLRYLGAYLGRVAARRHAVVHNAGLFATGNTLLSLAEAAWIRVFARRYVHTVHNLLPHDRDTPGQRRLHRWLYRLPHTLVVHTPRTRQRLVDDFGIAPGRIVVMEHGIDRFPPLEPARRDALRAALGLAPHEKLVLLFGNVGWYKGPDIAIDAMAAQPAGTRLLIAGRCRHADIRQALQQRIAASPAAITWWDRYIGDDEVGAVFQAADVLAMPYRRIEQSGVLFMALSTGLPVVASDVGAFADYVPRHAGAVVPPEDPAAFAQALAATAPLPWAQRSALADAARRWDWRRTVRALDAAYAPPPWIAVMDLAVTRTSPAGSCVLAQVNGLADTHAITVFADRFEREHDGIRFVRVPLPQRPGFLKYLVFHLLAPGALRRESRRRGRPPSLVQATQGQYLGADICYPHFCHRAYLAEHWPQQPTRGLRRVLRWCSYRYNAFSEARAFRQARLVVAPSAGLVRELVRTYPFLEGRTRQVPNPVDVERFRRPPGFDRAAARREAGVPEGVPLLCFVALGDFERKGLGLVLDAMAAATTPDLHLVVVGGNAGETTLFAQRAAQAGVAARCRFAGFQRDVRPFLWMSDLFVFPSVYEIFSLVLIQAPAAGLPVVATALHGFEEYALHGENAWVVARRADAIAQAIDAAFADPAARERIAAAAEAVAQQYSRERFVQRWQSIYAGLLAGPAAEVEDHDPVRT